jgi:hypothetical protein
VEVTACPDEPQNETLSLCGQSGNVSYWESSNKGSVAWTTIVNNNNNNNNNNNINNNNNNNSSLFLLRYS